MADRRIIDHFESEIAIAVVAAVHVETDRRDDPLENIRIFLLADRAGPPRRRCSCCRAARAIGGAIANLDIFRQFESAGKIGGGETSKSYPLATFNM